MHCLAKHIDNDDDGETAAGSRLLHLMSILDVKNVVVVVSRYFLQKLPRVIP
jgi:putative IMPACT (imprinted ancient) family translation regulator